jgi:hypothetical protein
MSVRNCGELGINLQKIVTRLLNNDDLIKLLYYVDKDPFSQPALTKEEKQKNIYEKLLKITPRVIEDESNQSYIVIYVTKGSKISGNSEFINIQITIDVVVPLETWVIKDSNLRPFAILGQIQESLEGKTINGLGKLSGGDFDLTRLTDKISIYSQTFSIIQYD